MLTWPFVGVQWDRDGASIFTINPPPYHAG